MFSSGSIEKSTLTFILSAFIWLCSSCGDQPNSHGLDATYFGLLKGQVNFASEIPANTSQVQLFLLKEFDPDNILTAFESGQLSQILVTESVRYNPYLPEQVSPFQFEAPYQDYEALVALWIGSESIDFADPFRLVANIVGAYCSESNDFQKIRLEPTQPTLDNIVIDVDLSKVDRSATVGGKIRFQGPWPDNFSALFIGFLIESTTITDSEQLFDVSLCRPPDFHIIEPASTPLDSLEYTYDIAPQPTFIVVGWQKSAAADAGLDQLLDIKIIGIAGLSEVAEGQTVQVPDIIADFDNPLN
jgi:hypothetical protein